MTKRQAKKVAYDIASRELYAFVNDVGGVEDLGFSEQDRKKVELAMYQLAEQLQARGDMPLGPTNTRVRRSRDQR